MQREKAEESKSLESPDQFLLSLWKREMSDSIAAAPNDTEDASTRLEILIEKRPELLAPLFASCCIYRVPERLRCLNPNVYTPKVVSIGPLHHGEKTLQDMEEHKKRYLKQFLHRTRRNLEYYIEKIRHHEEKLRSYYAEPIKFSSDKFISIILVDAAFIIELLLKFHLGGVDFSDRIIRTPKMIHDIRPDLLLLENQLPFFILEDLFNPESEKLSIDIIQLFCNFFINELDDLGADYKLETLSSSEVNGQHFLDLVRKLVLPPNLPVAGELNDAATLAPSITELHQAGVKLQVLKSTSRNLYDIRFDNGILEIPRLIINDRMEYTLKNLTAFEQCQHRDLRITDYLALLDSFVNTDNDVELLVKYGIVTNYLGDSREVCSMINSLCKRIHLNSNNYCFATLCENLHNHCKMPWNKWKANLRQNYLNTPWAVVSVVAAAFLIILTIIQTVCSLISL